MSKGILQWLRKRYKEIVGSIALYPIIIALTFFVASWLMLEVDFSQKGREIKLGIGWKRLSDSSTARAIVSTITAGMITMTVFTFSMVMLVLNQAASHMSNRVLGNLIENKFQQIVLGIYIGTIVYSLFLLTSIRDTDQGTSIPSLSIYLLILLMVVNIFLFIYFLHFITQAVKYETVINNIRQQTLEAIKSRSGQDGQGRRLSFEKSKEINSTNTGYYQGFNVKPLLSWLKESDKAVEFLHPRGTFVLAGMPFAKVFYRDGLTEEEIEEFMLTIDFYHGQSVNGNYYYGFKHLAEVGIRALSPGINDPATAVLSLEALISLLDYFHHHPPNTSFADEKGNIRVISRERTFEELFFHCIHAIWKYGKNDQYVQNSLMHLLQQLRQITLASNEVAVVDRMLTEIREAREGFAKQSQSS